ncbi:MAG TPA: bifunctional lytic transglycosylase/C40 family peptidase [Streptosporangiaceae bacterium]|jgi:hypothetical protein
MIMVKVLAAGVSIGCLFPVLVVVLVVVAGGGSGAAGDSGLAGRPTALARRDVPAQFLAWYMDAAQTCPGLPWAVLAGIGKVESDHGRNPAARHPNGAGARGPMQFLPGTFARYAVDGDRDGRADIYGPADAVFTAARYLCASGARGGSERGVRRALFAYNHAGWYVDLVLSWATRYATQGVAGAVGKAIAWARRQLGTPYVYGGDCTDARRDPTPHNCDCSSLVQQAYAHAGIHLPRTTYAWRQTGPVVALDRIRPGDLLYSAGSDGTRTRPGHVVMYLGGGRVIQAPHTGDVVKISPLDLGSITAATRPVERGRS